MAGKSPLHFACQKNSTEFVEILLLCQADPMSVGAQGELPMHDLLSSEGRDTVKLELLDALMRVGVTLDVPDGRGWSPMHHAADKGFLRVVQRLLEARCGHAQVNADGETPLHLAAQAGYTELTQALVLAGPDVIDLQDSKGFTPLHKSAAGGHADAATVLVQKGANTLIRNRVGQTALDMASRRSRDLFNQHNPELVALLHKKDPDSGCMQM
jgi:cytohesin